MHRRLYLLLCAVRSARYAMALREVCSGVSVSSLLSSLSEAFSEPVPDRLVEGSDFDAAMAFYAERLQRWNTAWASLYAKPKLVVSCVCEAHSLVELTGAITSQRAG